MTTTPEQIDAMRNVADALSKETLVSRAWIDDWGRYGNFTLMIIPSSPDRHTTNRLKALVRRHLADTGAHLRQIFGPDPIMENVYVSQSGRMEPRVTGYRRDYWSVDVDFHTYDPESNTFNIN